MKQIYNFDANIPPILNEQILNEIIFKKRLQRQTALLALGGMLMQGLLLYMALLFRFDYPIYSISLIVYIVFSFVGFAVISIFITTKRRNFKCVLPL